MLLTMMLWQWLQYQYVTSANKIWHKPCMLVHHLWTWSLHHQHIPITRHTQTTVNGHQVGWTYLLCNCGDESLVVRDNNHSTIPGAQSRHQRIQTLYNSQTKKRKSGLCYTSMSRWLVGWLKSSGVFIKLTMYSPRPTAICEDFAAIGRQRRHETSDHQKVYQ